MEWHTLDDSLRRENVIEGFQSFIWAERYYSWGDFQIVTRSTFENRSLLTPGTRIGMEGSYRVMTIETIEDVTEEDGTKNIKVTGRSLESILDDRVAMPGFADLTTMPKWEVTGTPGWIVRYMFEQVCYAELFSANDFIPFYHTGTFLPAGTIPESPDIYTISFDPASLYSSIQKVCQMWLLGFRLVKNGDSGEVYFDVYTGDDRTTDQQVNRPVVFSSDMESISKSSSLHSIAGKKTVAYIFSANGTATVYADGYDSSVSGADRRILLVMANDISLPAGPELDAALQQKGKEELSKCREVYAFDGEISLNPRYVYGTDYNLGDLVEERNPDGFANYMLVTEQIFISDGSGERSYPALTLSRTITPGTWVSLPIAQHWDDVDVALHWDDE
jgi:Siphovirus ReqiPepy6 Gp37-like protein